MNRFQPGVGTFDFSDHLVIGVVGAVDQTEIEVLSHRETAHHHGLVEEDEVAESDAERIRRFLFGVVPVTESPRPLVADGVAGIVVTHSPPVADKAELGDEERFVEFPEFRHEPVCPQGVDVILVEHHGIGEFGRRVDPFVRLAAAVRGAEPQMFGIVFAEEIADNPVVIAGGFRDEVADVFPVQIDDLPVFQHLPPSAREPELRNCARFAVAADQKVDQRLFGGDGGSGGGQLVDIAILPAVFVFRSVGDQHRILFSPGGQFGDLLFCCCGESGIVDVDPAARQEFDGAERPVLDVGQADSDTFGFPFKTRDAVPIETPAWRATSFRETLLFITPLRSDNVSKQKAGWVFTPALRLRKRSPKSHPA